MDIQCNEMQSTAIKLEFIENGKQIARAHLFLITNELHQEPYGLLEDVYVQEEFRGQGFGSKITRQAIEKAKERGCYKLICTSRTTRPKVHELYEKLGFTKHGFEFRMNLN